MNTTTTGPTDGPPPQLTGGPLTLRRQLIFWTGALVVFILLLWLLGDVLMPFIAGMALAYLLDPLVRQVQRLGLSRAIASVVVVLIFISLIALALILLVPVLAEQIADFVARVPHYVERLRQVVNEASQGWVGKYIGEKMPEAQKSAGTVAATAASWAGSFLGSLWTGGRALVSVLSLVVITPIVAFYLLLDWPRMLQTVDSWTPIHHRETVRGLAREMDNAIAGFVRGQAIVCMILGTFYAVALMLMGVNFGLLIGITAAILGFAPYVGTITGFLLAVGVATAQFWPDWHMPAMAAAVFLVGQFVEGNILQPQLVGKEIGLHPVWLMFSLIAFAYLFGFVGLLVAVPVAAAIGVLVRFLLRQYMASSYYTGGKLG
ncbi:AI-2E family transporter [Pseudorhodoplanes sp.]|uniref:AI-2E family transporter n=1 Tax=Pseudorhodoplanes sp. TaxID=1934341 RepID=UPI002C429ECB|nr:AI-2E family transporter [Pseudorhodoplanes sp.]HWV53228.1 AI-2E family transporter [Pseudorhodoplanes sp.]